MQSLYLSGDADRLTGLLIARSQAVVNLSQLAGGDSNVGISTEQSPPPLQGLVRDTKLHQ